MTVLVTGATGTVGREVVRALLERGAPVRALTRDPRSTCFDPRVEVVPGDLTDPGTLGPASAGVVAAHLITFTGARGQGGGEPLTEVQPVVDLLVSHGVRRVTLLHGGGPTPLEDAVRGSSLPWTSLQAVEFMSNALEWAGAVRSGGEVAEPFVDRLSAMVHESDIGDVAAVALLEPRHEGQSLVVTGPEVLTVRDKVATLATALGRPVPLRELSQDEAVRSWREQGHGDDVIGFLLEVYGDTPEAGRTVTDTVPRVTGHPARTFAGWARDHADAFR